MKTAKATVTALLYTSKTLANGEHPVMIRVCYNGRRKYKARGFPARHGSGMPPNRRCAAAIPSR